jgi:hypothetical protein
MTCGGVKMFLPSGCTSFAAKHPDHSDQAIGGRRRELEDAFPNAAVRGFSPGSFPELCDVNDRHVLAAVIHGQVDILVTDDRKARFEEVAVEHGLDVYTADEFLMWVAEAHPHLVLPTLQRQLEHYNRNIIVTHGRSAHDLVASLRRARAHRFAQQLEDLIAGSPGSQAPELTAVELD